MENNKNLEVFSNMPVSKAVMRNLCVNFTSYDYILPVPSFQPLKDKQLLTQLVSFR